MHHGGQLFISQRQWRPSFSQSTSWHCPNGNNLHSGKGFKLSGSKMVKNEMKLRVATPFTANQVNPIPMLSKVWEMTLLLDPTSCLKAPKSSLSPIMAVNKILEDDKIFAYAFDLPPVFGCQETVCILHLVGNQYRIQ